MRATLAVLASLSCVPAAAQAQTAWGGTALSILGNRSNGCDVRIIQATHSGSTLNPIEVLVANRAGTPVRVTAEATLMGDNQRRTGLMMVLIGAHQQATMRGLYPFGGSLAGSRLVIRFLGCTPG